MKAHGLVLVVAFMLGAMAVTAGLFAVIEWLSQVTRAV